MQLIKNNLLVMILHGVYFLFSYALLEAMKLCLHT
jgi:hypothetical protein